MLLLVMFESIIFCFFVTIILWYFSRKSLHPDVLSLDISFAFFTLSVILTGWKRAEAFVQLNLNLYSIHPVLYSVCMGISAFFFSYMLFDISKCDNVLKKTAVSSSVMILFGFISTCFMKSWLNVSLYIWIGAMSFFVLKYQYNKITLDNLTGLHNRFGMDEEIREQLHQYAKDKNDSFYMIVCDLDNFKYINDRWGHNEGDRALILISSALLRVSEEFDSEVFRIGGDEFVIITDTSEEGLAENIVDRIKKELDMIDFRDDFDIKMSMGISFYDGKTHIKDLLECADKKMYEAKKKTKLS